MNKQRTILLVVLIIALSGCDGFNPFAPIFTKMGKDITDTSKHAERMAQLILEKAECQQFKDAFLKHGREAVSFNGAFTTLMQVTKEAANKAGCSKA